MIPIKLIIDNITDDIINIDLYGITVKYKDMYYIVSVHMGLPIKSIHIEGIPKIDNYILSKRNDLLIIPVLFPLKDQFVFCHFDEKQIDYNESYFCGTTEMKLNSNIFLPINMIPNNPTIMYHMCAVQFACADLQISKHNWFRTPHIYDSNDNIKVGMPVYNIDRKLRGIVAKMDDTVYVLPAHYIINTILKPNNIMIMKDTYDIVMMDHKMIKNNKIYCKNHKTYIPIDCYVSYHMDLNITNKQNITKKAIMKPHKNRIINDNKLIRKDNEFVHTSGYVHLLQILGEYDMIQRIISF